MKNQLETAIPKFSIDLLEPRLVLSTGPLLSSVELTGTVGAVNAVVLTFNEPLDPTSAQNVKSYAFGKPAPGNSGGDDGLSLSDFFPFVERANAKTRPPKLVKNGKIQFSSATYNATAHSVTLTPIEPFNASRYFRALRVKGTGANALHDVDGSVFNSGNDEVLHWKPHSGKSIHYVDSQHDHVSFKLTGPGKLYVFVERGANPNPMIFIQSATAASTLTGTVANSDKINASIQIDELEGAQGVTNNLVNNPSFVIEAVD